MPKTVTLGKLEVAERQLDTAIWLWFNEGDLVSINLLTGSAFGVLDGIFHDRKMERPMPFSESFRPDGMTPRQVRNVILKMQDFSKHARNDATDIQDYNLEFTELYLFWAIMACDKLVGVEEHGLRQLFLLRASIAALSPLLHLKKEAECFVPDGFEVEALRKLSKRDFFLALGGDLVARPPWISVL